MTEWIRSLEQQPNGKSFFLVIKAQLAVEEKELRKWFQH